MQVEKLIDALTLPLQEAEEIWIATALITDEGLDFIDANIPPNAIQHFLIGIDLPTPVSVLNTMNARLRAKAYEASIYQIASGIFHPKLYILKSKETYIAFIGSANLTRSGLEFNVELSTKITDQQHCLALLKWFRNMENDAYPLNQVNIDLYAKHFESKIELENSLTSLPRPRLKKASIQNDILDGINFSGRYFQKEHHYAFRQDLIKDTSPAANKERKGTFDRFITLHDDIYPRFKEYGIAGIEPNKPPHVVSMFYHADAATGNSIGAMWLSYGKSPQQIKEYRLGLSGTGKYGKNEEDDKQSFINHSRLQVRIDFKEIGIWILFGKNNGGSIYDRDYFFRKMKDETYRLTFFSQLKTLPRQYWIRVNKVQVPVSEFQDADTLYEFCKKDNPKEYFIVGRDYAIEDKEMSEQSLPKTVLTEFKRLLPLYLLMRHKF